MKSLLLIILSLFLSINIWGQDSLLKFEFCVFPFIKHTQQSTINISDNDIRYFIGPSFLINKPVLKKSSIFLGITFTSFYEQCFNKYTKEGASKYNNRRYDKYIYQDFRIKLPFYYSYNYPIRETISVGCTAGFNYVLWKLVYIDKEVFAFDWPTPLYSYKETHFGGTFLPFSEKNFPAYLDINFKYFPFKHFGISVKPFAEFNFFEKKNSLVYGVGVCICYK